MLLLSKEIREINGMDHKALFKTQVNISQNFSPLGRKSEKNFPYKIINVGKLLYIFSPCSDQTYPFSFILPKVSPTWNVKHFVQYSPVVHDERDPYIRSMGCKDPHVSELLLVLGMYLTGVRCYNSRS